MLERLRIALGRPRLQVGPPDLARELAQCLGPASPDVFSPPGRFARMVVLERKERPPASPAPEAPTQQPRSLAEIAASVSLALLDQWGNPGPSASFELMTPDASQRSGTLDGEGLALQESVQQGSCELQLPELGGEQVRPRTAPPDGWLRDEVSVFVREVSGVPWTALQLDVAFDNGVSRSATLDAEGTTRLQGSPSWPLRVSLANLDVESWD